MRDGEQFDDLVFELKERAPDGSIKLVKYRGAWEIVDNGYLSWPTMIPPSKNPTTYAEMRFSKWVESLRKDVECTFGILKGRFRILKNGIPLHGIEVCDQMWLTCCALHNFLLVEDGLDETWDASNYLTREGGHDQADINSFIGRAVDARHFDSSGMGLGSDLRGAAPTQLVSFEEGDDGEGDERAVGGMSDATIRVCSLGQEKFKQKLVEHFDIVWNQREVKWPSRKGHAPPPQSIFEH